MRPGAPGQVIQGKFVGPRPLVTVQAPGPSVAQPAMRGPALQLPPSFLQLKPAHAGQRLPREIQLKMEALFRSDFSDVRVHVGPEAPALGAIAFTYGSQLYFAPGQYVPGSAAGWRLIAHELTHVLQQRTGRVRNP